MKNLLMGCSALAALTATPSYAACNQVGLTVTCSATSGTFASGDDDLVIDVEPTATVDADPGEDAFDLDGTDTTLTNRGEIISSDDRGIDGGDGLTVINGLVGDTASITAVGDAIRGRDGLTLRNRAVINGGDEAVQADDFADIINYATGMIFAADKGFQLGNDATIENHGQILSFDEAIEAEDDLFLTNTGTIVATEDAVQSANGTMIYNYGIIESDGGQSQPVVPSPLIDGDGIDVDGGAIYNYAGAAIRAAAGAGIDVDGNVVNALPNEDDGADDLLIYNEGEITGLIGVLVETDPAEAANTSAQTIVNYGTIAGTTGTAFNLGGGQDSVTLFDGSMILGDGLFGGGNDLLHMASLSYGDDFWDDTFFGGAGFDEVRFEFGIGDLLGIEDLGSEFRLDLGSFDLLISGFETLSFSNGDGSYTSLALPTPAVPLPASLLLLGTGLAGLGLRRARRA